MQFDIDNPLNTNKIKDFIFRKYEKTSQVDTKSRYKASRGGIDLKASYMKAQQ